MLYARTRSTSPAFQAPPRDRWTLTSATACAIAPRSHGPLVVSGATGNPRTRICWANTLSQGAWSVNGAVNDIGAFDLTDPSLGVDDCAARLTIGVGAGP